ncbi:unnamed protein product, partial [Polarella glacialis]
MLSSAFSESSSSSPIDISDMSPAVFEGLLSFLYRGCIDDLSPTTASDILRAADKVCMEGLVTYCIEYILDGNLSSKSCCGLLRMASELGKYGRSPVWKPLHQGCLVYIRDHLAQVLQEEGGQAFLRLDQASLYLLLQETTLTLAADRNLLLSIWSLVRRWFEENIGAGDIKSIYKQAQSKSFAELEFLESVEFSFKLEGISKDMALDKAWLSEDFAVCGYTFSLQVERASARKDVEGAADYYGCFIMARSRPAILSDWGCVPAYQFELVHPTKGNLLLFTQSAELIPLEPFPGGGRGIAKAARILEVELPESGYVIDGCATVKATMKEDPLLGLCSAAAVLDFGAQAQDVLRAFPCGNLLDILRSYSLAIRDEDDLLDALVQFAEGAGEEEEQEQEVFDQVDKAAATLRMEHIHFAKLLNAAQGSRALQRSHVFAEAFKKLLKEMFQISSNRPVGSYPSNASHAMP